MALQTITLSSTPTTLDPGSSARVLVRNVDSHPVNLLNGPQPSRIVPGQEILLQVCGPVTAWTPAADGGVGTISYDAEGSVSSELTASEANAVAQSTTVFASGLHLGGNATLTSGAGAPSGPGTAGDIYFRTGTPSTSNQRIYICTVTSTTSATWVGIL